MNHLVVALQDLQQFSSRIRRRLEKVSSIPLQRRDRELDAVGLDTIKLSRKVETFLEVVDKELSVLPRKKRTLLERTAMPVAAKLKDEMVSIQSQLIVLAAAA